MPFLFLLFQMILFSFGLELADASVSLCSATQISLLASVWRWPNG